MTSNQVTQHVAQMATAMADLNEIMVPIIEAARGYRAQLEAAGYSPTMAEHIAAHYQMQATEVAFKNMSP